jgi:hypothetical protein
MARKFFYACAGLLCLMVAYHLGASTAGAQAPGNPVVSVASTASGPGGVIAMTAGGDTYSSPDFGQTWYRYTNCFGASTPAKIESFGQIKSRYR